MEQDWEHWEHARETRHWDTMLDGRAQTAEADAVATQGKSGPARSENRRRRTGTRVVKVEMKQCKVKVDRFEKALQETRHAAPCTKLTVAY